MILYQIGHHQELHCISLVIFLLERVWNRFYFLPDLKRISFGKTWQLHFCKLSSCILCCVQGYTIPLDKRLAADGRGMQSVHINENFAKLAEALYIADRKAREAVEVRAQIEKKMAQKEKEKREEGLRMLAQKARDERAGIRRAEGQCPHPPPPRLGCVSIFKVFPAGMFPAVLM